MTNVMVTARIAFTWGKVGKARQWFDLSLQRFKPGLLAGDDGK
jgi:hypothetical protein